MLFSRLPSPLSGERFSILKKGVYDDPEITIWINEKKDFALLEPLPVTDYKNYIPRVEQLGLVKYKVSSEIINRRLNYVFPFFEEASSVLEIGASDGAFLNLLNDKLPKIDYYAVEPDVSTKKARDKLTWLTQYNELSEAIDDKLQLDVIALFHVFEHIINPSELLDKIKVLLKPGGIVLIEVPSLKDPLLSIFNQKKYQDFYFQCQHPYIYSSSSLERVLKNENFEIDKIKFYQRYGIENHLQWLSKGIPGGNEDFRRIFESIDNDYRKLLESEGLTDTVFVTAKVSK